MRVLVLRIEPQRLLEPRHRLGVAAAHQMGVGGERVSERYVCDRQLRVECDRLAGSIAGLSVLIEVEEREGQLRVALGALRIEAEELAQHALGILGTPKVPEKQGPIEQGGRRRPIHVI